MESRKMVTDEHICRAGIEKQTQKTDLWTQQGKERVGRTESSTEIHTLPYVKEIELTISCYITQQRAQPSAL